MGYRCKRCGMSAHEASRTECEKSPCPMEFFDDKGIEQESQFTTRATLLLRVSLISIISIMFFTSILTLDVLSLFIAIKIWIVYGIAILISYILYKRKKKELLKGFDRDFGLVKPKDQLEQFDKDFQLNDNERE